MSLMTCLTDSADPACNKTQTSRSYIDIERSMFVVGQALVDGKNTSSGNLSTDEIHVSVNKISDISRASSRTVTTRNIAVKLPESLKDSAWKDSITSQIVMFNESFAKALDNSTRFQPATEMATIKFFNSRGQEVYIDSTDSVDLTFNLPQDTETPSLRHSLVKDAIFNIPLLECCERGTLSMDFTLGGAEDFTLILGTDQFLRRYQLRATVTSTGLDVFKRRPIDADVTWAGGNLTVSIYRVTRLAGMMFAKVTYTDLAEPIGRRRLLQSESAPFMTMKSLSAVYYDKRYQIWTTHSKMTITNVSAGSQVRFTSNFLGAFTVSKFLIPPNMINFNELFLDFSDKLESTPHVLALNCVLIFLTILAVIFLRRLDRKDSHDWNYLPLIGNRKNDSWHYAISVTTSAGSNHRLDAVPCFRLIGQYGQTRAMALQDGVRENFKRSSTNNFIMSASSHLGPVFELKLWLNMAHSQCIQDAEGESKTHDGVSWCARVKRECTRFFKRRLEKPRCDWKVDYIAVKDLSTGERYTFVIKDWLSETHGDGRTYRHVPVLDPSIAEGAMLFSLISRRKLFDEHLWLSVARRPTYSIFTRVQRFMCAVSILFLTMVTNAMWYQADGAAEESVDAGIDLGPIRITFRTLQVGVFSSLIVMIPAIVMTYFFRRRRQRPIKSCQVAPGPLTSDLRSNTSDGHSDVSEFVRGFVSQKCGSDLQLFLPARIHGAGDVITDCVSPQQLCQKDFSYILEEYCNVNKSVDMSHCECVVKNPERSTGNKWFSEPKNALDYSSLTYQGNGDMKLVDTDVRPVLEEKFYTANNGSDLLQRKLEMAQFDIRELVKTPEKIEDCEEVNPNTFTHLISEPKSDGVSPFHCSQMKSPEETPDLSGCQSTHASCQNSYVPAVEEVTIDDSNLPKPYHYCTSPYRHAQLFSDSAQRYEVLRYVEYVEAKRHGVGIQGLASDGRWLLPWWSVFMGYALVVLSIASSAFITFFYSLEWGGETTLKWMASIFFATTSGTFLLEPIKILILTLALSCLFRDHAHEELSNMAPVHQFYSKYTEATLDGYGDVALKQDEPTSSEEFSSEIAKQRTILKFQQRLSEITRVFSYHVAYVLLFVVLCTSTSVPTSYRQNNVIRLGFNWTDQGEPGNIKEILQWLSTKAIPYALPKNWPNGDVMSVYQQKFTSDLEMYRLAPMSLTQWRVRDECSIRKRIQDVLNRTTRCSPDYTEETKETGSFDIGWVHCKSGCDRREYNYTPGDQWALDQFGELAVYSPGGYKVLIPQERADALSVVNALGSQMWLDRLTRALLLELAVYNANTRLFTQVKALFELPSSGGVFSNIEVRSANLYPYTTAWDYLLLLAQIGFAVSILIRLCALVHLLTCSVIKSENRPQLTPDVGVEGLELAFSVTAVAFYTTRVVQTINLVEYINNNPAVSASMDTIFVYDELYTLFISSVFFVRILRLLGPMSINSQLYILRYTLISSTPMLLSIGLSMVLIMLAFASFFYLYEGPVHDDVKSVYAIFSQLLNLLLAMAKSLNIDPDTKDVLKVRTYKIMSGIFSSLTTIFFFNFAISLLNLTLAKLKSEELLFKTHPEDAAAVQVEGHGHRDDIDRHLGTFVWEKIGSFFNTRDNGQLKKTAAVG